MTTSQKIVGIVGVIGLAALLFGAYKCGEKAVTKTEGTVKVVRKDSLIYVDKPVPYKVDLLIYVKGKDGKPYPVYDTLWGETDFVIREVDTAAILARFYETAYYMETKDTGRTSITITDTVTQNRIAGRSVKVFFTDTVTTNTVVLTKPNKFVLSFGISAMGSIKEPFHAAGVDLSLKLPNNKAYGIGTYLDKDGKLFFGVQYRVPLKFSK